MINFNNLQFHIRRKQETRKYDFHNDKAVVVKRWLPFKNIESDSVKFSGNKINKSYLILNFFLIPTESKSIFVH